MGLVCSPLACGILVSHWDQANPCIWKVGYDSGLGNLRACGGGLVTK